MAREHIRAFADVPGVTLAGVFSRTRERADSLATEFSIGVVADSIDELYGRTHADLVVIAVPELATREQAMRAFVHGWTVLIEKPAGHNLLEAIEIADEAKTMGRQAFVALNRRAYSSTRAALAGLSRDAGVRFVRVLDQQDPVAARNAGQPPDVVANWMFANSIHTIDLMRVFGRGAIREVRPIVPWDPAHPSVVLVYVAFESGDTGIYEGIWDGPGPWALQVTTSEQLWELRPLERAAVQPRGTRVLSPLPVDPLDSEFKAGFKRQAAAAADAALGEQTSLPTLADGVETMRLIQAIFEPA